MKYLKIPMKLLKDNTSYPEKIILAFLFEKAKKDHIIYSYNSLAEELGLTGSQLNTYTRTLKRKGYLDMMLIKGDTRDEYEMKRVYCLTNLAYYIYEIPKPNWGEDW